MRWSPDDIKSLSERVAIGPLTLTLATPQEARSLRNALYRRLRGFEVRLNGRTLDIRPRQSISIDEDQA